MQDAVLQFLAPWQSFYVIVGTAAATLTALMFVVITVIAGMNRRAVAPHEGIATFSTPSVVHFCAALLVAALLSAPWQAFWNVGLLFGLCGVGGVLYTGVVVRRARRQTSYQPVLEDWLWHTIFPLLSYTAFVVAAIILLISPTPALFIIAAGTVLLLFIGIHNAWDNVTYMTIELAQRENKKPN